MLKLQVEVVIFVGEENLSDKSTVKGCYGLTVYNQMLYAISTFYTFYPIYLIISPFFLVKYLIHIFTIFFTGVNVSEKKCKNISQFQRDILGKLPFQWLATFLESEAWHISSHVRRWEKTFGTTKINLMQQR